jgi:hypothetical protein
MTAKTTRILKEARPLFWPWCVVALAGALASFFHTSHWSLDISRGIWLMGWCIGIPLLAALPFGNEFQHRTLPLLLSQPISRMEIWREKLLVTLFVVLSAVLVFSFCSAAAGIYLYRDALKLYGAWIIAMIASATFWTLFARSTLGAVILSIAVPSLFIFAWTEGMFRVGNTKYLSPENVPIVQITTFFFLCYAGAMLWLGWRKLARFQATGAAAGDDLLIAGPDVMPGVLAGWLGCRPTGAVFNLIRKEIRLLRPVWLVSLLAAVGWACLTGLGLLTPRGLARDFQAAVVGVGVISTLMIAILAGSLSLGEERTSGTHLWHLTLPVSAGRQWFIKLGMALFTGFVGAWLLPVLIAGRSLLISSNFWDGRHFGSIFLIAVLLLTFTAFWCACAVNGTVRAVLWVVPVMVVLYFAGEFGKWAGPVLTRLFFSRFDPFANVKFAHAISRFGSDVFFRLIYAASSNMTDSVQAGLVLATIILVPTLLYAVIQSYRLFRAQLQNRTLFVVRSLLLLAMTTFLCNFFLFSLDIFVGRAAWNPKGGALFETVLAIQKIQSAAPQLNASHPLQLTVEDLAKAFPLSKSTRRLLGNSHITLRLDEPPHHGHFGCAENPEPRGLPALRYSWYSAVVPLADGSHFFIAFDPVTHYTISAGFCK